MTTSRAEKRRQERENKKSTDGFSRQQLKAAEQELESFAAGSRHSAKPETTFTVLVNDWHQNDHQLEELRLLYQRTAELKERGRQVTTEEVKKGYAQVKESLELIEDQMVDLLVTLGHSEVQRYMDGRFSYQGIAWNVPEDLAARLMAAVAAETGQNGLRSAGAELEKAPTGGTSSG